MTATEDVEAEPALLRSRSIRVLASLIAGLPTQCRELSSDARADLPPKVEHRARLGEFGRLLKVATLVLIPGSFLDYRQSSVNA